MVRLARSGAEVMNCYYCGGSDNLTMVRGTILCQKCREENAKFDGVLGLIFIAFVAASAAVLWWSLR